jgi:hypothetical protein
MANHGRTCLSSRQVRSGLFHQQYRSNREHKANNDDGSRGINEDSVGAIFVG